MDVRVLKYEDTVALLSPADCVAAIRAAYEEEAQGWTVNRPRSHSVISLSGNGSEQVAYHLKTMEGIIKAKGYAALRVSSQQQHSYMVNGKPRDPYHAAIPMKDGGKGFFEPVMLFRIDTGELVAIMPGGYIQAMRVGSSTAVGNSYMARPDSSTFGIIGSGWQARAQLRTHAQIFGLEHVKVFSTTEANRDRFAREMSEDLGVPVTAVGSAEEATRGSDVLLCATSSHDWSNPVFDAEWLEPGMHWSVITREAGPSAFERTDRLAVLSHVVSRNAVAPADDLLWNAEESQPVDVTTFPTLADLVAGRAEGRGSDREITGFVTTQGMGIQFVALASLAYERAAERGVGSVQNWDHLLQTVNP